MSRGKKNGNNKQSSAPRAGSSLRSQKITGRAAQLARFAIRSKEAALYEKAASALELELVQVQPFGDMDTPDLISRLERELIGDYSRQEIIAGHGVLASEVPKTREPRVWSRASQAAVNTSAKEIMLALQENPDLDLKELLAQKQTSLPIGEELWSRRVDGINHGLAIIQPAGKNLGRKGEEMALYSQIELSLAGAQTQVGNTEIVLESNLPASAASKIIRQALTDTLAKKSGYKAVMSADNNLVSPF